MDAKNENLVVNIVPENNSEVGKERMVSYFSYLFKKFYSFLPQSYCTSYLYIENMRTFLYGDYSIDNLSIPLDNSFHQHCKLRMDLTNRDILMSVLIEKCYECSIFTTFENLENNGDVERLVSNFDEFQYNNKVNHGVLGGTFDSIHVGHKLLLSEAALRCSNSLTVGVTDGSMIEGKTLFELIRPVNERIEYVKKFLKLIAPSLCTKIVPIYDPFGPSISDPNLELIVVSDETLKGGQRVNEKRLEKGLSPLKLHRISLIEDTNKELGDEDKMSSSSLRKKKLGTRIKPFQMNDNVPVYPHVIGLTGGIASGKSSIAKRLENLGAGIVDCDSLGHRAYLPGTKCFEDVLQAFGDEIKNDNGTINRKALGSIVFSNRDALNKLNSIVWPQVTELAKAKIKKFRTEGKNIVVLDAAVLLEANWNEFCHEVWVTIIPPEEAVKRLMDRNGLQTYAAWKRVEVQFSNIERVKFADIVFSTLWEPEFTQKQVIRAWDEVEKILKSSSL
ncbi:bifunctional coenzyme A synthase-like [Artemia franciscana]|uniref:Bifunctional coenzyme A synthase n=1 Tax=Artemia franciscana TaxID=6661 RepID=A0AA88L2L8_ARTSF|nr:hypothetical protein QYM36_008689 [Artemia franciscana]